MKNFFRILGLTVAVVVTAACCASARAEVWTVPAPEGQGIENAYRVQVDGKDVAIYRSFDQEKDSGEYYFATFEFTGSVEVKITAPWALDKATVAPERFGVKIAEQSEKEVTLTADKPFQISFEPNGHVKPLMLFGLAPEENAPKEGDPNVVYYGPGVYKPDMIELRDNQTLYVAAGAVVNAGVHAQGKNITICGRGVIAGTEWKRFEGPGSFIIHGTGCENLTIRDVVLRDPWSWTCVLSGCDGATIDGLRICASNMINDDALDLCNTKNVVVKNCFFRAQDDSIAIKGLGGQACENIRIEDCVFWTDRANIFRVGYECQAEAMRNIVAKNIDVLGYSVNYRAPEDYWSNTIVWLQPNQEMLMSDCHFEDFRIRANGTNTILLEAKPMSCSYGNFKDPIPGTLENCSLKNFSVYGEKGDFFGYIYIRGESEQSHVKGLKVENIDYFGEKITKDSDCVSIGDFTEDVVVE
ncbi:MAG: hypothetical protein IK077_13450 [Thermoguttaceae bacterium]|nr:hypothetical protein [Thermoguttaceae bacterium]